MRSIVRNRRPVLEIRGAVRILDRADNRPASLPVGGECRLDVHGGAILDPVL